MTKKTPADIRALATVALLLAASLPASALLDNGVDPAHLGKGDWIWEMNLMEANNGLSSVQAVVDFEKAKGMQFLIVKCCDGEVSNYNGGQFNTDLITRCHAAGLKIFGFGYVYGTYYGSGQVAGEIAAAIYEMGIKDSSGVPMDGFLIDAEIEYNGQSASAITYCQGIRAQYPTRCLMHSPYPVPSYNESFPYIEFGRYCDAVFLQDYWYDQFASSGGMTPAAMLSLQNSDWIYWQGVWQSEGDGSSVKPLYPIGQGFQGDSPTQIPGSQLTDFYNAVKSANPCATAGGYQGISFWDGQDHMTDMWNAIAAMTFVTPPAITNQPVSLTNCQGSSATFSVTATGTLLSYQWQKNGGNISGATTSALTLSGVTTNNNGTYAVQISNSCGTTTNSAAATLVVSVPPVISFPPQSTNVCQGGSASFSVTASGTPLNYQWQFNGTNLSATLSSYTLSNLHTNKTGSYSVVVSNACGVVTSAVAVLTVPLPPCITTQPGSQVASLGANVSFCVTACAGTFPSYQWQFNGNALSGASSCYTIGNVHANKAGAYTTVLTNGCGVLTSSVAWLTLVAPLVSQTATQGAGVTFTVTNYGADPTLVWQWQQNGTNLSDGGRVSGSATTNLSLSNLSTNDAGSYTVMVSNSAASFTSAGASLTVVATAAAPSGPARFTAVSLLPNQTVQLTATGTVNAVYYIDVMTNVVSPQWMAATNWTQLASVTNTSGTFQYTDPAVTNGGRRFYRMRLSN
jgi:hypothetical protein